jgi:hypothetical protein
MSQRFTVVVEGSGIHGADGYDEGFVQVIRNRAGRKWVSKRIENCPGNAGESAMFTEEVLNGGDKLNENDWIAY